MPEFRQTLEEVVTRLDQMPPQERTRWVEFLSYIHALVYHARSEEEQPELREIVDSAIQADPHRQEYRVMGRTIAEMYLDQGREQGRMGTTLTVCLLRNNEVVVGHASRRFDDQGRLADENLREELAEVVETLADAARARVLVAA